MNARYLARMAALTAVIQFVAAGSAVAGQAALPASPGKVRPLLVGASMPPAQLQTVKGESLDLGSAIAAKPTILVFYRGGW